VRRARITLEHCTLNLDRAAHRRNHALEFHQGRMAGYPANTAAVFPYPGINQFSPLRLPQCGRGFFVRHDESAVADDIGCENGHESPHYLLAGQEGPSVIAWGTPANVGLRSRTRD